MSTKIINKGQEADFVNDKNKIKIAMMSMMMRMMMVPWKVRVQVIIRSYDDDI